VTDEVNDATDHVLELILEFAANARLAPASGQARLAAVRAVLDSLGCALGAYHEPVPRMVRSIAARRIEPREAHILGTTTKVPADMAAFANGVMVRFLDYNDTYVSASGVGHPSDYIPALLATAEVTEASGGEILDAIVLTYEIFCRLIDVMQIGVEDWDHVVAGAVASAVGAAHLCGMPADQLRHAISLALVPNMALQATRLNDVSLWKGCASGNAARNGLFALELAAAGVTAPARPFTGRGGFFPAVGRVPRPDAGWRAEPAILACDLKRYPAGYFSQSAIQAALALRDDVAPAAIRRIEVGTFSAGLEVMAGDTEKWRPTTRETADHSLPYVVASALANGKLTEASYRGDALTNPDTRRLLDVLQVVQDDECQQAWPAASMNRLTVHLDGGVARSHSVTTYRGHHRNPLTNEQLHEKFTAQVEPVLGAHAADRLADSVWSLQEQAGISPMLESLVVPTLS